MASELHKTALRVVDGYNQWNIDAILAPRTEGCTQQVVPARLNRPLMTSTDYRKYFADMIPIFKNFHLEVLESMEDPAQHKVTLHIRSTATTALGDYANEYMIICHMTDDDRQVKHITEFVDSGYSVDYFTRLREYMASQK